MSVGDLRDRIDRLGRSLGRFEGIGVERIAESIFEIRS